MCLPHNNSLTRNARIEAFWGVVRDSSGLELNQSLIWKIHEKYKKNHIRVHNSIQLQIQILYNLLNQVIVVMKYWYIYFNTRKICLTNYIVMFYQINVIIYTLNELSVLILLHWIFHFERWWRFWGFQTQHSHWWLHLLSSVQGRW